MKEESKSNYEKLCDDWRGRFLEMDRAELRRRLPELREEGEFLTIFHFGKKYGVKIIYGSECYFVNDMHGCSSKWKKAKIDYS